MSQKIEALLKNKGGNYILPFFWQHGESEEVLREYMKVISESNIGAVCVESRPHPDYCGPQWWHDMDIILDEAKKRNMKVWILDDSHFPSGYANGAMASEPDELCRQSIVCDTYTVNNGDVFVMDTEQLSHPKPFEKSMIENFVIKEEFRKFNDDRLLTLMAVRLDGDETGFVNADKRVDLTDFIIDHTLTWNVPQGEWKIYSVFLSRNFGYHRSYINMMDRRSCRVFIDAVYEPHYAHYKDDFGKTIAGFFSDEPELGNGHIYEKDNGLGTNTDFPWSLELEEALKQDLGDDFAKMMPLLWETAAEDDLTAKIRYTYMNRVSLLVKENFSDQIGDWCREHGVKYIGHLIEDNNHSSKTGSSLGHYFRGLAGQDWAGIDDIGGQVFPGGEDVDIDEGIFNSRIGSFYHYTLGKLASSAAAIEPNKKGNSMCEIFGAYGWSEGVNLEKYLADHFMVRGINHFVPHAFSPKEFPDPDCPPHFYAHGHNPQYRHFGALMQYMNRVCELISDGHSAAEAAIIYDGEADWTGTNMKDGIVGHKLYDAQIDYDIIPQDVFAYPEVFNAEIETGYLRVNHQKYNTIICPQAQFITDAFAKSIIKMSACGIDVIFVDRLCEGICDFDNNNGVDHTSLLENLASCVRIAAPEDIASVITDKTSDVKISPADNRIRVLHYLHPDQTEIYYFVNEGTDAYRGKVSFVDNITQKGTVYGYDAWNNQLFNTNITDNSYEIILEPKKSMILVVDPNTDADEIYTDALFDTTSGLGNNRIEFSKKWIRSTCESISYPQFSGEKTIDLPDSLEIEQPKFSGFVRYENEFEASAEDQLVLEITDASEGVEVFINDESLGIQVVPTYIYSLTGKLNNGKNRIRIEVATTLERAMASSKDPMGRPMPEPSNASGISGNVILHVYS